ncbi:MAG: hypothetical protein AAF727_14970, partial [Pseudomonadota bacterium]
MRSVLLITLLLLGAPLQAQLLDLGDPISLDDDVAPEQTVAPDLQLDVAAQAIAPGTPVTMDVDGVFFIPVAPGVADSLWSVAVEAAPRTRVGVSMVQFQRAADGLIEEITTLDSATDVPAPYTVAIPRQTEHLEIATSGPATVTLTPLQPVIATDPVLGQTGGIQLADRVEVTLDYTLTEPRTNLRAALDLPANVAVSTAMRVNGRDLRHHVNDGQPVAADALVERVTFQLTRARAFADDPWPIVPLTLDLAPIATDEVEPNQDIATATPIDWPEDDRRMRVDGRFAASGEDDFWQFQHFGNRALTLTLDGENVPMGLQLIGADGDILTETFGTGEVEIAPVVLPAGTYFLRVQGGVQRLTPYTLKLRRARLPDADEEVEPNDILARARPLTLNETISGRVSDRDIDHFTFDVSTPGQMWGAVAPGDVDLKLLTGAGVDITRGERDTTTGVQRLPATALPVGTYVIAVTGRSDYTLTLRDMGPKPDDWEEEPNGRSKDANYVAIGGQVRGQSSDGDADYVYFDVPEAQYVGMRVTAPDDATINVELEYRNTKAFEGHRMGPGRSIDQVFWLEPGEYSIYVGRWGSGISQDSWTVEVYTPAADAVFEAEPNGQVFTRLQPGERIIGREFGMDPWDGFSVALPDTAGEVIYACRQGMDWIDYALGPIAAEGGELDSTRFRGTGEDWVFAHDGTPGQAAFIQHYDREGGGYDCAPHWMTPATLQAAYDALPLIPVPHASGYEAGGARHIVAPASVTATFRGDAQHQFAAVTLPTPGPLTLECSDR